MKNTLNKISEFLSKNILVLVLLIFLIMSVGYNIKLKSDILGKMRFDIIGTFSTGNFQDAEYFVFTRDGEFYNYKQFELLKKGNYEATEDVITLKGKDVDEYIVYSDNIIYYFDEEENAVFKYDKISDVPTFMNLQY